MLTKMQESSHLGNEDTVEVIIFKLEALHSSFQNQIWSIICFNFQLVGSPVSREIILCPSRGPD